MFADLSPAEILALASPLVLIQLGLAVFCFVKILKEGTANLNKVLWSIIVIFVNFLGPLAFLLIGRKRDR
jgi:hypothetical protein